MKFKDFEIWLNQIIQQEKPPSKIKAYNFGLFKSEANYKVCLIGSFEYDSLNDDWACEEDWVPENKYFEIKNSLELSWQMIQEIVLEWIGRFIASEIGKASFLSIAEAITVGFDDGDLEKVQINEK